MEEDAAELGTSEREPWAQRGQGMEAQEGYGFF